LVGRQEELVRAMLDTGKPVIALVFGGRPLAITTLAERAHAVLQCWYLGQETGGAVADVLFGDFNPGGKLPMTIPRSAGHVPAFYNYKPSARLGYLFGDVSPLYPFGLGLSYTTFRLDNVRLTRESMARSESTTVQVELTNTGRRAGTEVVQVYIRDRVSTVTRPVKELKGFAKVRLEPGEKRSVTIDITPASLAFFDINMDYVVEPGEFEIMVGTSSRDSDLQTVILKVTP
jgi:beta-glucosidase